MPQLHAAHITERFCRFVVSGTPSTEITENIVKYEEIYAGAPNEKVAAEVCYRRFHCGCTQYVMYEARRLKCYG